MRAIDRRNFCAAIVSAAFLMSCGKSKDHSYKLEWMGGPLLSTANFYFENAYLGEGQAGFALLLEKIEAVPDASTIAMRYPSEALVYYEDNYSYFTGLPLTINSPENKQWVEIARTKRLQCIL